ncbi:hypothetical protein KEM54_005821 [Ascosphaera aggregata]|nr:hypothetical protein KEM54_005821 [Ascosphaera aggregata]
MEDYPTGRRRDTACGPPLRILSLDGGGVRGFSMFILLQELMYRTYVEANGDAPTREQIPKPCEMFDLIVGTGTGGLIAIMLGRLRMDLETCKEVYVRMTKKIFETDKTLGGIPFHSTIFKASRLEEAICECVREHTTSRSEGKDGSNIQDLPSPPRSPSTWGESTFGRRFSRGSSTTLTHAYKGSSATSQVVRGNPYAALYDARPDRCKTAVTAVYKNTPPTGKPILLRSYDSRREPPPDFNCTIWQAGRATSASALAFKPVKIGQYSFLDEGAMNYNPAPQALDEAVLNEWPGREVGVFVSIGTGKRSPSSTKANQSGWLEGIIGSGTSRFAEARRRLITKIDGCEETHQYMLREHLAKRNVNPNRYIRLNVNVGVGGYKMNEWNRLGDISTNTRIYLGKEEIQRAILRTARDLAQLWMHHQRDKTRRTFSGTSSLAAPSLHSFKGLEEEESFSDAYSINRLPCCPEDEVVAQSLSESLGSSSPKQPTSPICGTPGPPYRTLRHRKRHTLPLRLSTSVDSQGPDSGTIENGGKHSLPLSLDQMQNAFNNSQVNTTRTWSTSDLPRPQNLDRRTSDDVTRGRRSLTVDTAARPCPSETISVPKQRNRRPGHVGSDSPGSRISNHSVEAPTSPYQETRRRRRRGTSQTHHSPRRSALQDQRENNYAAPDGSMGGVGNPVDPSATAFFNDYTSIIPPYPVDEDDSVLQIPDATSTRESSRPGTSPTSTSAASHPPNTEPTQHSAIWPLDPIAPPSATIPMPPPRAQSRLWSASSPIQSVSTGSAFAADLDHRHERQVSSATSIPPTVFSTGDSGESLASTQTTMTAGMSNNVRPKSAGNDKGSSPNPVSTVAVVNGCVEGLERRPATSGGEFLTQAETEHVGANLLPENNPWEHGAQRPVVNWETKPTLLSHSNTESQEMDLR